MNRLLALTALLTICAGQAAAQCGNACAPSLASARLLEGWHPSQQWPGWQLCYVRGVVVAGYRQDTDAYCTYHAATNRWSPVTAPPWGARSERKQNFGVDESKLRGAAGVKEARNSADGMAASAASAKALVDELVELHEAKTVTNFGVESSQIGRSDRYTIGGAVGPREVPREEALRAVGNGGLTDDSNKPRLTVIGAEADRKRVLADFESAPLAELKGKLVLHSYAPDHWHVAKAGFKTDGKPTIYLQRPDGVVMHRQDDYSGGAPVLAQAIRKADPNYDPSKDGNLAKPKAPEPDAADGLSGLLTKLPGPKWLYVVGVAVAGLYYFRDKLPSAKVQAMLEDFETVQAPAPRPRRESGYRPAAQAAAPLPMPPQGGSAMMPPPLPPAAIQSRPEMTIGRLLQDQLEREQREEEAAKRRAAEREADRAAFRKFAGLDVPAPNPVPVPAPSPEPDQKG